MLGVIKHMLIEKKKLAPSTVKIDWKFGFVKIRCTAARNSGKKVVSVSDEAIADFDLEVHDIKADVKEGYEAWLSKKEE